MAKRKKTTSTPSLSTTSSKRKKNPPDNVSADEAFTLKNMIKQQLGDYIRKNKIKDDTATLLTNMLQEYLSCCLVIGYDFQGQPMTIISVNNQQEADAIGTHLQRFITNSQSQSFGPPGGFPPEPPMM